MKNVTRWKPDTCACVLEYEWDTDTPEDSRVHTPKTVTACAEHSGTTAEVFTKVEKENKMKNEMVKELLGEGATREDLKKIRWSFDASRNINVEADVPKTTKTKAEKSLTKKYGAKVKIT